MENPQFDKGEARCLNWVIPPDGGFTKKAEGLGGAVDDPIVDPNRNPVDLAQKQATGVNPTSISYWSTLIGVGVVIEEDGFLPFEER